MTRTGMAALLGPEFDAFLFAPVDEGKNGVVLSVLSALARLDVDPWLEAAELARMPREAARQRLATLVGRFVDAPAARSAPATTADRLIRLLPRGGGSGLEPPAQAPGAGLAAGPRSRSTMVLVALLLMFGMLCAQWGLASRHPPAETGPLQAQPGGKPSPQMPQPMLDR